jgi:peptidoglycan/LPS O-acetylase OafA/YrhL
MTTSLDRSTPSSPRQGSTPSGPRPAPDSFTLTSRLDGHVPALDGIRGVAILFVMLFHYGTASGFVAETWITRKIIGVFANMWSGVDIFFTLSGFLITGILLRLKNEPRFFSTFYMRRTLRIFPLYYSSLAVIFLLLPLLHLPALDWPAVQRVFNAQGWLWAYAEDLAITYHNDDFFDPFPLWVGHFWSLAVEEHFYLLWPVVVYLCSRRGLLFACFGLIALGPITRFVMLAHSMDVAAVYTFTLSRADELAIGGLLALLAQDCSYARLSRWARWAAAGSATYLVISVAMLRKPFYWTYTAALGFGFTMLGVGVAALIVFAVGGSPRSLARRAMEARWLRVFGKYSYGAYVLHTPLQPLWMTLFPPRAISQLANGYGLIASQLAGLLGFVTLGISLTMVLAVITFHSFEQRFNRLKRFWQYGQPKPA